MALIDDDLTLALMGIAAGRGGSDRILDLVDLALGRAGMASEDLDVIAVSRGPGSLTGLRVGIGTAQGLATGSGKRLVGVSTLQAAAWGHGPGPDILALLNAGRGELYGGLFETDDPPRPIGREQIGTPEAFAAAVKGRRVRLVGEGAARCAGLLGDAAAWSPPRSPFLALGVARVAAALIVRGAAAAAVEDEPAAADDPLSPEPRYVRRGSPAVAFGT